MNVEEMFSFRPAPSTEIRSDSCCHSQIGWRRHVCKGVSGCIITHSKKPLNSHLKDWERWEWGLGGMSFELCHFRICLVVVISFHSR